MNLKLLRFLFWHILGGSIFLIIPVKYFPTWFVNFISRKAWESAYGDSNVRIENSTDNFPKTG